MTSLTTSDDGSMYEQLEELSHQYTARIRRGEKPDIEEYTNANPELAESIRELFEAILFAEQLNCRTEIAQPAAETFPMQLGPFVLQREIGRGGMGIVYEATQSPFTQTFAVKVLKSRLISSRTLESRFEREAQAASKLHHPNIVPAKHYGTEGDKNFLVMPMIDGVSLDKLVKADEGVDPKLFLLFDEICSNWRRIAELGAKIASALSHAHSLGMVHRDIKPANLILARDGNIWVTDFGLAKLYDDESDLSRTGELIGTPRYMAPEQILGVADERSDIYGVGLTLYELIVKDCPWAKKIESQTKASLLTKLESHRRKSSPMLEVPDIREVNPTVPPKLARVIMKACAHHPEDRYQTAREFELDLNEICYHGRADRRNSKRSRALASTQQAKNIAVLIAVATLLSFTSWIYQRSKPVDSTVSNKPAVARIVTPGAYSIAYEDSESDVVNVVTSIGSRADDAEELAKGRMYLDSYDLELTWDEFDQTVGLRFAGVRVPKHCKIISACLCFCANRSDFLPTELKIQAIDDSNLASFRTIDYDLSSRPRTFKSVDWSPETWSSGEFYESPDISELVQYLIDKPGWAYENAMGFVITGKGIRAAWSYDGDMNRPAKLKVEYRKIATEEAFE